MAKTTLIYNGTRLELSYTVENATQEKSLLFLHGWGSNKEIMYSAFKDEFKNYKLVFVDMPGFGKSKTELILTTFAYGDIMQEFINKLNLDIKAIFGHSFGGKVATLLNPPYLVLLSSAGILEEKSPKTLLIIRMAKIFNKFGLSKVTKLLRSKDVNMMDENMYETFKNVVDEDFSQNFTAFRSKAYIFWGEQDEATSLASGKKIDSLIKNSTFTSYSGNHYFFLEHSKEISTKLEQLF